MLAQLQRADPEASVLALGDWNDFHFSPSLKQMWQGVQGDDVSTGNDSGESVGVFKDLMWEALPESERWNYIYDGDAQSLDHIFMPPELIRDVC